MHTLASLFGEAAAQNMDDDQWLAHAGQQGLVVLMKDKVYRVEANRDALAAHAVRAFCLTRRGLRGAEQAAIIVAQRHRIIQRSRKPGPYVYGVYVDGIRPLWMPTA